MGRVTSRATFLAEMDHNLPWKELAEVIEPACLKEFSAASILPSIPLERLLRIYFLQLWFSLSDQAAEDALYDCVAMCRFTGIDLHTERAPEECVIREFRNLMTDSGIGDSLREATSQYLSFHGKKIRRGFIMEAALVNGPVAGRRKDKERSLEFN